MGNQRLALQVEGEDGTWGEATGVKSLIRFRIRMFIWVDKVEGYQ